MKDVDSLSQYIRDDVPSCVAWFLFLEENEICHFSPFHYFSIHQGFPLRSKPPLRLSPGFVCARFSNNPSRPSAIMCDDVTILFEHGNRQNRTKIFQRTADLAKWSGTIDSISIPVALVFVGTIAFSKIVRYIIERVML